MMSTIKTHHIRLMIYLFKALVLITLVICTSVLSREQDTVNIVTFTTLFSYGLSFVSLLFARCLIIYFCTHTLLILIISLI